MRRLGAIFVVMGLLVALFPLTALAHHPEIEASTVCNDQGVETINWRTYSWLQEAGNIGSFNSDIRVLFDDVEVAAGAFTVANGFEFSGANLVPAGAGPTVTVTAVALAPWSNGTPPGDFRSVEVAVGLRCGDPAVDIEKATNGVDADLPTGPTIFAGDPVEWTYVVTNTGDTPLTGVTVVDDQGVVVSCPATELALGGSMTCTASGTATLGQYANMGTVTTNEEVTDTDPSHYIGEEQQAPAVDIEKATNGVDADLPTGPTIFVGDPVEWTYVVTNTGNVPLTGVTVVDDQGVVVSCPATELALGGSMTCTASGTATLGQYANMGTVTTNEEVTDTDPSHYIGVEEPQPELGTVGDYVWNDFDEDGIQDAGEPGVPGVAVALYSGETLIGTTTTDAGGKYLFTELPAGEYMVVFTLPTGWEFTAANQGADDTIDGDTGIVNGLVGSTISFTLPEGGIDLTWDAGIIFLEVSPTTITTTTTTTVPETTSTLPETTSTSLSVTSTSVSQTQETLPHTGVGTAGIGGFGAALVALGGLLLLVTRRREEATEGIDQLASWEE